MGLPNGQPVFHWGLAVEAGALLPFCLQILVLGTLGTFGGIELAQREQVQQ